MFLNIAFLLRNCQILSVFQNSFLQIHFGSGAARIRNDFVRIWILLKVLDPTGSGFVSGSTALTLGKGKLGYVTLKPTHL